MTASPWIPGPPLLPGEPGYVAPSGSDSHLARAIAQTRTPGGTYDAELSEQVAARLAPTIAKLRADGLDEQTVVKIASQQADLDRDEIETEIREEQAAELAARRIRTLPDDGYVLEDAAASLRVERLRRERGELVGELIVECSVRGARTVAGVLHAADFNLSSARARTERAKILAERARTTDLDWIGLLEELCQSVLAAERRGAPALDLRDAPLPGPNDDLEVDRLRLPRRHPAIVFGDGGSGKSMIGLHTAGKLAEAGMTVLYADWEYAPEDHRARLGRMFEELPQILYVRCERPLTAEADRLARLVREHSVDYLIVDSIAFACDGPPESAEVAAGYFRALRRIGVGSLNIAHVTKSDGADQKPFGSAFWHNGARMTWYVARSSEEEGSELVVGLFNRKVNDGARERPFSYRITFGEDRIAFHAGDVNDVSDLAARLPLRMRLRSCLRTGAMTYAELGSATETDAEVIRKTIARDRGQTFVKLVGQDGITRWGLRVIDGAAA